MTTSMHVSLTPALKRAPSPCAQDVLDPAGPRLCIGGAPDIDALAIPVKPDASTTFGPRGACLCGADGPLWIADTGHHRLLGWDRLPERDDQPADWLIGQPDFSREGRNAKGAASATTLNVPTGITRCGEGLAVADAWNHRVLIWHRMPRAHNTPADVVLGQADFTSVEANRGAGEPTAQTLFWPYGVYSDGERLWVSDTGNRRVLMWHRTPRTNGAAADLVLGQSGFLSRDENGGGSPDAGSMRWPHAIAEADGRLLVTDAGNNRIMIWNAIPTVSGAPCDAVLGQRNFADVDHNQSLYWPSEATLQMPYGVAAAGHWCLCADTANSRLIAWPAEDWRTGAAASALSGQVEFNAKGDNAWAPPTRRSLCWPYAISVCAGIAVIADSGNNRILVWNLAKELRG
jgi:hypothetical protein